MAQATILAAGTTAATSTDVTVAAGGVATVGLFVASGSVPAGAVARIMADSPGADIKVGELTSAAPAITISGPGTFRVIRPAGMTFGIYSET